MSECENDCDLLLKDQPTVKKNKRSIIPEIGFWEQRKRRLGLHKYNQNLIELKSCYLEDEALKSEHCQGQKIEEANEATYKLRKGDRTIAILVLLTNLLILGLNLSASILSGSLSIISTLIDSIMDLTSSGIINCSLYAIKHTDHQKYPRGRGRLDLLSVMICSVIMGIANIMMVIQSVEKMIDDSFCPKVDIKTILIILSSSLLRFVVMVVCIKHNSSSSRLLAMDLKNDAVTSVLALCAGFVGTKYWRYADPIGAISVCTIIAASWFHNAVTSIPMIVGVVGERQCISRILNIAITHSNLIKAIDFASIYHVSEKVLVELHIILINDQLPLKTVHDLSESLQKRIQTLENVESVFVHADYQADGDQGSRGLGLLKLPTGTADERSGPFVRGLYIAGNKMSNKPQTVGEISLPGQFGSFNERANFAPFQQSLSATFTEDLADGWGTGFGVSGVNNYGLKVKENFDQFADVKLKQSDGKYQPFLTGVMVGGEHDLKKFREVDMVVDAPIAGVNELFDFNLDFLAKTFGNGMMEWNFDLPLTLSDPSERYPFAFRYSNFMADRNMEYGHTLSSVNLFKLPKDKIMERLMRNKANPAFVG
uniref:ZT_dimer domain-containing protein n=1 Tax=Rhabditophanes sp. KR3021 TaxID=114890 RepID=A0AC35U5K4_9BILA